MKVKGKVIWITGASSGIGEALAYTLSQKGANLILSARRRAELERVMSSCDGSEQNIKILPLDIAQRNSLKLTTAAAIQLFGHIDILINNAGISQRSLAKDTPPDVDRKIMEVNYFGTIELTKYLLPHFLERKSGQYVTVTSLVGKFGTPYRSGYSASKHALHGFFDSLRAELHSTGITTTIVCPGFIHTNVSVNALTETGEKLNKMDNAQASGMAPEVFAKKMIAAIEANKREVYIGGKEKYGVYIKRFFPGIFANMVRKAKVR
ncbi:putative oxidoreductase/dehydrogenase [Fulvivirga imtechensis AK7]|uniref:Putative oxidoreductase/dehydrogenase n=1 Tax=Fulvivirga imtechensis AK7 TaxID=1237149 RepID=L8K0V4_9BACT|nr:SDR family oxidoreductase [Fulvivirga imtechensis]ELR73554.1 putative oxidoreductase/dehydrogenase [Fulvivirga imtechensis AK7]